MSAFDLNPRNLWNRMPKRLRSQIFDSYRAIIPQPICEKLELKLGMGVYKKAFLDRGYMFFHVPKAAGTSVSDAVFSTGVHHHRAVDAMRISPVLFEKLFKFGFVRNPYDRLFSAFHYMQRGGTVDQPFVSAIDIKLKSMGFAEFVLEWLPTQDLNQVNPLWVPQCDFLCDSSGQILVDFVGRFETLDEDFVRLTRELGVGDAALPHRNKISSADYREFYPEAVRAAAYKLYRRDFEIFGYSPLIE
jgi:hypothetical protein